MKTTNHLNTIETFLNDLFSEIAEVGIDIGNLKIDHIAYTTESSEEYGELLPEFSLMGKLIQEAIISERRVAIIKLDNPVKYKNDLIDVIELIEPTKTESKKSEWEHAEFLVDNYDEMLNKYPSLNWNTNHKDRENFSRIKLTLPSGKEVKFLNMPVLKSAELEK